MGVFKTLGFGLLLVIGLTIVLLKSCSIKGRNQAREFCDSVQPGISFATLKQQAETAGRGNGVMRDKERVEIWFPWWIDNAYLCRVHLDGEQVIKHELLDCGWVAMTPPEARQAGDDAAAQIPEGTRDDEYVEVNVCEADR